ncbi:MAG: hypothetical protein ACTS8Z_06320, partial [Candidatus Limnocylindrales bacterium]
MPGTDDQPLAVPVDGRRRGRVPDPDADHLDAESGRHTHADPHGESGRHTHADTIPGRDPDADPDGDRPTDADADPAPDSPTHT